MNGCSNISIELIEAKRRSLPLGTVLQAETCYKASPPNSFTEKHPTHALESVGFVAIRCLDLIDFPLIPLHDAQGAPPVVAAELTSIANLSTTSDTAIEESRSGVYLELRNCR